MGQSKEVIKEVGRGKVHQGRRQGEKVIKGGGKVKRSSREGVG